MPVGWELLVVAVRKGGKTVCSCKNLEAGGGLPPSCGDQWRNFMRVHGEHLYDAHRPGPGNY